ncbi:MAG: hypothetical protein U1F39_06745 [Steroidobacteraceae bacterium]
MILYYAFVSYRQVVKRDAIRDEARAFTNALKERRGLEPVACGLILKPGERAYYSSASDLYETRAVRHYESGNAGIRVAKGVWVGRSKGRAVSNQEWGRIDTGTLIVTNKRLVFDGGATDRSIALGKILSVQLLEDGIEVSVDGRQKSMVFKTPNSVIAAAVVHICTSTDNPERLTEEGAAIPVD